MRENGEWNVELTQVPDFLNWDGLRCEIVHDNTPVVRFVFHLRGVGVCSSQIYSEQLGWAFFNATKNRNGVSLIYVEVWYTWAVSDVIVEDDDVEDDNVEDANVEDDKVEDDKVEDDNVEDDNDDAVGVKIPSSKISCLASCSR